MSKAGLSACMSACKPNPLSSHTKALLEVREGKTTQTCPLNAASAANLPTLHRYAHPAIPFDKSMDPIVKLAPL